MKEPLGTLTPTGETSGGPMKPYGLKLGGNPGCNCGRCRRRGWREGATQNTICKASARQEAKRIINGGLAE